MDIRDTPQYQIMDVVPSDLEVKFDLKGHSLSRVEFELKGKGALFEFPYKFQSLPSADVQRVIDAWESNTPLDVPVPYPVRSMDACDYCGSQAFVCDGFTVIATEPCPYPNGYEIIKVELEVPSGFLIIGNDFRQEFPAPEDDYYVNVASEIKRCIEGYAQNQMLHFYVGNTCPGVYKTGEDEFIIANPRYEEPDSENPGEQPDDEESFEQELGEKVGSVCTDLWWVSIVDQAEADLRGLKYQTGSWVENDPLPVTPGTYQLEYYGMRKDFHRDDYSTPTIWAKLSRR